MFIEVVLILKKPWVKWGEAFFKEEQHNNPFVFENEELLEVAKDYLTTYIEQETKKIVQDKQYLIFTNDKDMPFSREDDARTIHLQKLLTYVEQKKYGCLTDYERAYLTYLFYNDIENNIMNRVLGTICLKGVLYKKWDMYILLRKIELLLKAGQEILFTELQEICTTYTWLKIWQSYKESWR